MKIKANCFMSFTNFFFFIPDIIFKLCIVTLRDIATRECWSKKQQHKKKILNNYPIYTDVTMTTSIIAVMALLM